MDSFEKRKKDVLEKKDKSTKGSWDSRVVELCKKINSLTNYYTTSSCSGKCVIMEEKVGKDGSYYLWESHDLINLREIKESMSKLKLKNLIKFKFQSPVLYVVCRDLESAKSLFNLARNVGFKESGIHLNNKLIGVEIKSGENLEFPLFFEENILVFDPFLKEVVNLVNLKFKAGWNKLEKLKISLN